MLNHRGLLLFLAAAGVALLAVDPAEAISVTITTSTSPPAPVGAKVTFSGVASGAGSNLWYRFRVREMGGHYRMIRDWGPSNVLDWTASAHEGVYEMEVSARDLDADDAALASTLFQFVPVVTAQNPVVSPTSNSLVFLYSAPACRELEWMRVSFWGPDGIIHQTPYQDCNGLSMNFYLAGMLPDTNYTACHTLNIGSAFCTSVDVTFTTGDLPGGLVLRRDSGAWPSFGIGPHFAGQPDRPHSRGERSCRQRAMVRAWRHLVYNSHGSRRRHVGNRGGSQQRFRPAGSA